MPARVNFDGPCPFLTCLETGPHSHEACPDCDAMRYANFNCPTCRRAMRWTAGPLLTAILNQLDGIDAHQVAD